MNLWLVASLFVAAAGLMALETRGWPMTLRLSFKGDIKRESQWLAQFGQSVATATAAALIYCFEYEAARASGSTATGWFGLPAYLAPPSSVAAAVICTSLCVFAIKRLTGRVRPNRPDAGKFLGPSWTHANWRESFPSNHSAGATALAVALCALYPQAATVFATLAGITAVLRYLMDAHWPSDVLAGIGVGYVVGHGVMRGFGF